MPHTCHVCLAGGSNPHKGAFIHPYMIARVVQLASARVRIVTHTPSRWQDSELSSCQRVLAVPHLSKANAKSTHIVMWVRTCSTLVGSSSFSTALVRLSMNLLHSFISSFIRCMPSSTCNKKHAHQQVCATVTVWTSCVTRAMAATECRG